MNGKVGSFRMGKAHCQIAKPTYICLMALILLLATGCSQTGAKDSPQQTPLVLDVERVGERLYEELTYRDQLEELPPSIVYTLLGMDEKDVAAQKNYFSSGATAEEIIVLQATDAIARGVLRLAIEARIVSQKEIYVSYAPEEVLYLQGAILEEKGDYIVYCVAADASAAEKLVSEVLNGK